MCTEDDSPSPYVTLLEDSQRESGDNSLCSNFHQVITKGRGATYIIIEATLLKVKEVSIHPGKDQVKKRGYLEAEEQIRVFVMRGNGDCSIRKDDFA
jgi:hypothetical protein